MMIRVHRTARHVLGVCGLGDYSPWFTVSGRSVVLNHWLEERLRVPRRFVCLWLGQTEVLLALVVCRRLHQGRLRTW